MPNLFLIDGASGAGKSALLKYCDAIDANSTYIKKYTDKPNDNDGVKRNDLIYLSSEQYDEMVRENYKNFFEYTYPKSSEVRYLILKSELDEQLRKNNNVFVIVRNIRVMEQIKRAYANFVNVNVITVFLYCDHTEVERRIRIQCREAGISDELIIKEKVSERLERDESSFSDYINNVGNKVYDHVILNVGNHHLFHGCIKNLVDSYANFDDKFSQLKAFIIMPFTSGWEWTHFNKVKEAIAEGARQQGFIAKRQDDYDYGSPELINSIRNSIKESILCIGDLTLARPNCYYEIGLAEEHLSLDAIILIKDIIEDKNDIHFDIKGRKAESYTFNKGNFDDITSIVSKQIKTYKENHLFITDIIKKHLEEISQKND